jgi:hypothetical protein
LLEVLFVKNAVNHKISEGWYYLAFEERAHFSATSVSVGSVFSRGGVHRNPSFY